MHKIDLAYTAGIIDGEGCISICRRKKINRPSKNWFYEPQIMVSNTDKRMIDFLVDLYGGWVASPKKNKDYHKQGYCWKMTGDNMKQLLKDILPYLICKKRQAEIVLSFPSYRYKGRNGRVESELKEQERKYLSMQVLNKKGLRPVE